MTFLLLAVLFFIVVVTLGIYLLVMGQAERREAHYKWIEGDR